MSSAPSSPSKRRRDDDSDGDASNSVGRANNLASPAKKAKTLSFTGDKHLDRHQRTRSRLPKSPQRTPHPPVTSPSPSPFPLLLIPDLNLHDNSLEEPQNRPPQDVSTPRTPSPIEGAGGLSAPSSPSSRGDDKTDDRDGIPKGVIGRTSDTVLGDGEFEKLSLGGDGGGELLDAAVGSLALRH